MNLGKDTPLLAGESIMSWVARIGREEVGMEPADFLRFMTLSGRDIIDATPAGIARLKEVTGVAPADFLRGTYVRIDDRLYDHQGQRFHAEFGGRDRTTYCPACLLADREREGLSGGQRVGRVNWLFAPVRTCPIHDLPLVRKPNRTWSDRFQDMEIVAPADEELQVLLGRTSIRRVSPLQTYVEGRLEGQEGPAWLDGQQIDLAVRATEILGMCVLRHPHVELPAQTETDWDEAGAVGYRFTSRGTEGIREALDEIRSPPCVTRKRGGPQAIFGRLYQWLQYNKSAKDRGPIREVVREYLLETMAIEPGTMLFGDAVPSRRRHSVASLARQFGLHYRTLNRAVVLTGLMPEGNADVLDRLLTVDASDGERLAERMRRSLSVTAMPAYLNCCRLQAEALVRHGVVTRIGEDRNNGQFGLNMVAVEDLDEFLARFRSAGTGASALTAGMADVVEASRILRWPAIDIIKLVLGGRLERVALLSADLKLKSVLVDTEEVRERLREGDGEGRLSVVEAAERLQLEPWAVQNLTSGTDSKGRALLPFTKSRNAAGQVRLCFDPCDVEAFADAHVELRALAAERGISTKVLQAELLRLGIHAILPKSSLNKLVYRRADL